MHILFLFLYIYVQTTVSGLMCKLPEPVIQDIASWLKVFSFVFLKALAEELTNAEQTSAAAKQYSEKAAFLASPFVLKHKDKGVRLYAACCLVDILRVSAPDAPFDKDQMWVSRVSSWKGMNITCWFESNI